MSQTSKEYCIIVEKFISLTELPSPARFAELIRRAGNRRLSSRKKGWQLFQRERRGRSSRVESWNERFRRRDVISADILAEHSLYARATGSRGAILEAGTLWSFASLLRSGTTGQKVNSQTCPARISSRSATGPRASLYASFVARKMDPRRLPFVNRNIHRPSCNINFFLSLANFPQEVNAVRQVRRGDSSRRNAGAVAGTDTALDICWIRDEAEDPRCRAAILGEIATTFSWGPIAACVMLSSRHGVDYRMLLARWCVFVATGEGGKKAILKLRFLRKCSWNCGAVWRYYAWKFTD